MALDISTNKTGFKNLSYSLTALPLLAFMRIDGFAPDGVVWETIEPATVTLGADGKSAVNQKPVLYTVTLNLLPNSNARNILDLLIQATIPEYGVELADYNLVLTEENLTTGYKTVYTGGTFITVDAGNSANLDDGQSGKAYQISFTTRTIIPV